MKTGWKLAAWYVTMGMLVAGCANRAKPLASDAQGQEPRATLQEPQAPAIVQTAPAISPPAPATPTLSMTITDTYVQRNWPQNVVYRPSGDVPAGPTYWPSIGGTRQYSDITEGFIEPVDFMINTVLLPVRAILTPPWRTILYSEVGPPGQEHLDPGQAAEPFPTTRPAQ